MKAEKTNRIRLKLSSFDSGVLEKFAWEIVETARKAGARVAGPIPLPVKKKIFTVLSSPFIDKNAREQFEIRIHKRIIDIYDPPREVVNALSNMTSPAGISIEVK
ncbi:MAG: 30S ribosomal protein S10 [bacterium JZ-2024 1]